MFKLSVSTLAACGASALLAVSAGSASAAPVGEGSISGAKLDTGEGLTAGYGYVAWIDEVRRGSRRIAVVQPDGETRRAWLPGRLTISVNRQIDLRTGRPVTRLVTTRRRDDGTMASTLRSPATLRPVETSWAAPVPSTTTDGAATVSTTTEPDESVHPDPASAPPSRCSFLTTAGLPSVPALPDCANAGVRLRGSILGAYSTVPSGTSASREKGQVNASALSIFSMQQPELGWRRLSSRVEDYDGSTGLQSACSSDQGIALLEGERRSLLDRPVATWTLRWVPADPAVTGWTATVPQLDRSVNSDSGSVWLACSGASIYAEYSRPRGDSATQRVVRFTPPR